MKERPARHFVDDACKLLEPSSIRITEECRVLTNKEVFFIRIYMKNDHKEYNKWVA